MIHLLNHVWPNIFETSPHVINAVMDAIVGLRVALGPGFVLMYALQGLFHPARMVRQGEFPQCYNLRFQGFNMLRIVYWKIYNTLYIGCADALVPYLPLLPNDNVVSVAPLELAYF